MKKQIELNNKKVSYTLKESKRAKRMRLTIHCAGDFVVTKPFRLSEKSTEKFIKQKSDWILSKLEHFKKFKNNPLFINDKNEFLKNKEKALNFILERIDLYNKIYKFDFNRISVRNQKTRWGSCSRKKNLNFNYKILFLSKEAADYIVVHELCHLREMNHSIRFWNLVAETIPNYLDIRKDLRSNRFKA